MSKNIEFSKLLSEANPHETIYTKYFYYNSQIENDGGGVISYEEIKMRKTLGPLKKNQRHDSIWFYPEIGLCKTFNEYGEETNSFNIKLIA